MLIQFTGNVDAPPVGYVDERISHQSIPGCSDPPICANGAIISSVRLNHPDSASSSEIIVRHLW